MRCRFHVGQKLSCITAGPWKDGLGRPSAGPQYGKIVIVDGLDAEGADAYVRLAGFGESLWIAHLFRPLTDGDTDISALRSLLYPVNQKLLEDA